MRRWLTGVIIVALALLLAVVVSFLTTPLADLDNQSPSVSQQVRQARAALTRGELQTAQRICDQILSQAPNHRETLLFRGQIAREQNDPESAARYWTRAADASSGALDAQSARIAGTANYLLATLKLEAKDAVAAESLLRQAIELNPTYVQPYERLVELYVLQLRTVDARRTLQQLRRLQPWTLDRLVLHELIGEGVTEAAKGVEQLTPFTSANTNDVASHLALARYYLRESRYEAATQLLSALATRRPDNADVAGLWAESLMHQGELSRAEGVLDRHDARANASEFYWAATGRLRMEQGNWSAAADSWARYLQLRPNHLLGRNQYALALQRTGDKEQAKQQHQLAASLAALQKQVERIHFGRDQAGRIEIVRDVADRLTRLNRNVEAVGWRELAYAMQPDPDSVARLEAAVARLRRLGPGATHPTLSASASDTSAADSRQIAAAESPTGPAIGPAIGPARSNGERPSTRSSLGPPPRFPAPPTQGNIVLHDVAGDSGLDFSYQNGASGKRYLLESMGGGVAVFDYDNDGWPDVYFIQGGDLPDPSKRIAKATHKTSESTNRLFRNLGDGRFEDVTEWAGVGDPGYGQGCAVGDLDNDGDDDLFVANYGANVLYENLGDGRFQDISDQLPAHADEWSSGAAFADFDRDGRLDLYVVNYVDSLRTCRNAEGQIATCDPSNFHAVQDLLLRNVGNGSFEDVTESSGIVAAGGKGLGLAVVDLDGDGWQDIYVANDGEPNFLFRNQADVGRIRFRDVARESGTAVNREGVAEAGMGVAVADLDYNGLPDLYVTHFHRESNTAYLNLGQLLFRDATRQLGLHDATLGSLGFGVQAVDLNGDSRWELLVANGHIDNLEDVATPWKMQPQLFRESGGGRFQDVSSQAGPFFQQAHLGRGLARLDWDRDGDWDFVMVHQDAPAALLENRSPPQGDVLQIRLVGTRSNRDGLGAVVEAEGEFGPRRAYLAPGESFYSHHDRTLLLGLGRVAKDAVEVRVRWPNGDWRTYPQTPLNRRVVLREDEDVVIENDRKSEGFDDRAQQEHGDGKK